MRTSKIIFFTFLVALCGEGMAAGQKSEILLDYKAIENINNKASLQRGAKYFVNYCSGCHSLKYMRMNTLSKDIGIEEEIFIKNLVFSNKKIGQTMTKSMSDKDAENWFGAIPPDLSLTARSKGSDYIYSLLNTFYADSSTVTGYNNLAFPNTSMPHILANLQGEQKLVLDSNNKPKKLEKISEGFNSEEEYQQITNDITNFLVYVSEPAKLKRYSMGFWVLLFIFIFGVLAYYTKKEFWKDVH